MVAPSSFLLSLNFSFFGMIITPPCTYRYRVVNPIPRNDKANTGEGFPPHCDESKGYKCSGMMDGNAADPTLEIVDRVLIPASLPAGAYVLGWRWDCEESNREFCTYHQHTLLLLYRPVRTDPSLHS
jgi:hypothetical protein